MAEHVIFTGARGQRLGGIVDLPDGHAQSAALVVDCFAGGTEDRAAAWIAQALAEDGYAVLRVDLLGSDDRPPIGVADVGAAADYLRSRRMAPAVLVGHSLGGSAVIAAAEDVPEARAVVAIGTPSNPAHFIKVLGEVSTSNGDDRVRGSLGGHTVYLDPSLREEVRSRPQPRRLADLARALLVMHSPVDEVVRIDDARKIFEAAQHPKSFVSLDGADHFLSTPNDARFAAHVLAEWAARYVDVPPAPTTSPPGALAAGLVQVRETGAGKFQQEVRVGVHTWTADEPVAAGGDDAGPSPYDLLLASLGTCTSMTLRMYVERKGWDVGPIDVVLKHDRIPDEGLGLRGGVRGRVDRFRLEIGVAGDLDDDQRESILRIAGRCPVHRTLTHDVVIETELAGVAEPAGG